MSVPLLYLVISVFSFSLPSLPYSPTHCSVFKVTLGFPVFGEGSVLVNARVLPLHDMLPVPLPYSLKIPVARRT